MTNLTLISKNDKLAASKIVLDVDNWKMIGQMPSGDLHLTTHDCKTFEISDMTISKFIALIRMGLEMSKEGMFMGVALACPSCTGTGVTDWVSEAMGKENQPPFNLTFERDYDAPTYKIHCVDRDVEFYGYFSRAIVPEGQQYCKHCRGTGLYSLRRVHESNIKEHKFV